MNFMNYRGSVGARLMLAFACVVIVFGAAVAASIARLAAFNDGLTEIAGPQLTKVETAAAWLTAIAESNRHTRNMLILDDKVKIQAEIDAVHDLAAKRQQYADTMTANVRSAEGKALLQSVMDARETLKPLEAEYLKQIEAGDFKAAKDTLLEKVRPDQLILFAAIEKLRAHQSAGIHRKSDELEAAYRSTRTLLIGLALAAVAVSVVMALRITRAFKNPLVHAVTVLGEIEKGNYASTVTVSSNDEIGQTLKGLQRMQVALRARAEKEHASAMQNARIRTALDRVSVGAMLSDPEGKVIYANDAVVSIFRARAGEIRTHVPSLESEQLVGCSLDLFQVPSLQASFLAGLRSTHTADVKMGEANLRIIANPVVDGTGQRVGTVVQWVDRTQEVSVEEEVQTVVNQAIEGNLTARIREEGKEAFFKTLAGGVNSLLASMADVVGSMAGAASEVRSGAEEISRGNADLSQRTEQQAASLEETASSMEEMTATVKNNADNAAQANQLASAAREQAEKGGTVVSAAVTAMREINASSKRIADIISVIDEIAFQTNLLALNAAVEAARAGEQGRGFAVVASEVRNLASRSAEAAKEIKTLIQDSVGKVTEGTRLVDESGKVLAEIVVRVKKVTDVMAEIASSSREQASGIEQVNKAITMMDDVTQQNAALVEEASAAARALTEQASNLTQLICRYQVGEGSAQDQPRATLRPVAVRAAAAAPERRAPTRPMTGKKRPAPTAPAAARAANGGAASEEWKDF
jgi:methyl-accepting chemotaxis protein